MIWRLAGLIIAALLIYAGGQVAWRAMTRHAAARPAATAPSAPARPAPTPPAPTSTVQATPGPCAPQPSFAAAAAANAASLTTMPLSAMGRPETGWQTYAPLVAHEIDTACGPETDGFAVALATWQGSNRLGSAGIMDEATLKALNLVWLRRRPFVAASAHGACPAPPPASSLAQGQPAEGYKNKPVQLRITALAAYRQMVAAARADLPALASDSQLLTLFSGYRDPTADASRCAKESNCGTPARANCSAHRTGLALDLYLGAAPGFAAESSADSNRLFQSKSAAYRWLVANAARFGFAPYPFEPWHWEWTGEAP